MNVTTVASSASATTVFHPGMKSNGRQMTKGSMRIYRGVSLVILATSIGRAHLLKVAFVLAVLLPGDWVAMRLGTIFYARRTSLVVDPANGTINFRGWAGDVKTVNSRDIARLRLRALKHRLGQIVRQSVLESDDGRPLRVFNSDYWRQDDLDQVATALHVPVVGDWDELLPYAQFDPSPAIRADPTAPQVYFAFGFFFPVMIGLLVLADHISWLS